MRKPETIETLYLDFDGFFASVMQQAMPELRGRPIGIIPFETSAPNSTAMIACSKEAKAAGCKNVMAVRDARAICPDLVLVAQRPDLFRRAHLALLAEISCEIPIQTVKSIDELACQLDRRDIADPLSLARRIKHRLREHIGPHITCSIGFAANRFLAKVACKVNKPDGVTIWRPEEMPGPLFSMRLSDLPGIGPRMEAKLATAGIRSTLELICVAPKHMRALWGNVAGERMWYALHGYAIAAMPTARGMYGHSRVLPPNSRALTPATACSRLLAMKAARRMRRDRFYACKLELGLDLRHGSWARAIALPVVQDDFAILAALREVWQCASLALPRKVQIIRVGVTLLNLSPAHERQLDLFRHDDKFQQRREVITRVIDELNKRFGKRVISVGEWSSPPGGFAGGKIAFSRIPSAEDFW